MDSIQQIDSDFEAMKTRRKTVIIEAFDGRTQQSIAAKTNIDATKLNRWINGVASLEDSELEQLEQFLGVDFK